LSQIGRENRDIERGMILGYWNKGAKKNKHAKKPAANEKEKYFTGGPDLQGGLAVNKNHQQGEIKDEHSGEKKSWSTEKSSRDAKGMGGGGKKM